MDLRDATITTLSNMSTTAMMLVHRPTGISVNGSGKGQIKLKRRLLVELAKKVSIKPQG